MHSEEKQHNPNNKSLCVTDKCKREGTKNGGGGGGGAFGCYNKKINAWSTDTLKTTSRYVFVLSLCDFESGSQ